MNTILTGHKVLRTCFVRYSSTYKSIVIGKPFTPTHRVFLGKFKFNKEEYVLFIHCTLIRKGR